MLTCEGYKMFKGTMRVEPKSVCFPREDVYGTWLYKPDTDYWYCNGRSYSPRIVTLVEDLTEVGDKKA